MSALEEDLTSMMTTYADGAPHDFGLLSRVQAQSARRTRARRLGVVATAAGLAGVLVVASQLTPSHRSSLSVATDPSAFFTSGTELEIRFPFTVPSPPPGNKLITAGEGQVTLSYTSNDTSLEVSVGRHPVVTPLEAPANRSTATVHGRPATVDCAPGVCHVSWRAATGENVLLSLRDYGASAPRPAALGRAQELQHREQVVRPVLAPGLVPKGCALAFADADSTLLYGEPQCDVAVTLATATVRHRGRPVTIAGYRGDYRDRGAVGSDMATPADLVELDLGSGRLLELRLPDGAPWNDSLLEAFVKAVRLP